MKFVVSYMSLFDNELKMTLVEAISKTEAMLLGAKELISGDTSWINDIKLETEDNIKDHFFNTDQVIEAIQI